MFMRCTWPCPFFLFVCASLLPAQSPLTFSRVNSPAPTAIALTSADFNHDDRIDVAMVTSSGTVAVVLCRGDGSFGTATEVIRQSLPTRFVIAADVNGDGIPDLIATHQLANVISVALGKGDGTFLPAAQYPAGNSPYSLVAADFNGDNKIDIAMTNNTGLVPGIAGTTVTVLLGNGNGAFGAPLSSTVLGQRPASLAAGDFNQDGKADLVVVNSGSPDISILISKGDGTFLPPVPLQNGVFSFPSAVAVADFNRDGNADIVVATPPQAIVWLGKGDGTFQLTYNFTFEGLQFVVADLNRDGVADLVGVNPPYGAVVIALGRVDGSFEPEQAFTAGNLPTDIAVGEMNSDGLLDIVLCHQSDSILTALVDTSPVPVISPNGDVNAASFDSNGMKVAPGEIVTIYGRNLGPSELFPARLKSPGFLDTTLDQTRVYFDDVAAPLIYVRNDMVSAVVPYGVSGKTSTKLDVAYGAIHSLPVHLGVSPAVPGIFTVDSSGAVAALNQDGTANSPDNPAPKGSVVTFFATGEGQTDPPGMDGKLAINPLPSPLLTVFVAVDAIGVELQYAGAAPGIVSGLMQINARIPQDASSGPHVPLIICVGEAYSQFGVTIAVE